MLISEIIVRDHVRLCGVQGKGGIVSDRECLSPQGDHDDDDDVSGCDVGVDSGDANCDGTLAVVVTPVFLHITDRVVVVDGDFFCKNVDVGVK
ncbi:Hypothetical predicted protein [Octopus vulgaris]|uniref:Uncharacterized protein n=1 Tax=Octopus vulgaris TaxID=6645 RepID=A0AA36B4I5_OCTVU|nr:Hypothetical predicted protein [Octopus vulgaris]